jgi:tetratricopeptide (TPR) repeat protein
MTIPRISLLVLAGVTSVAAPHFCLAQEGRGWGSSWTTPHSKEEKAARDISARLEKALQTQDWSGVEKALDDAQHAGIKSGSLAGLRAIVALTRQRYSEAVNLCDNALTLAKDQPELASNLITLRANAHMLTGEDRAARADLERALAFDKKNAGASNDYAWLLATCPDPSVRDGKRAIRFARAANAASQSESATCLDTLAAAEAEAGDFVAAIKDEKRALALAKETRAICERHLQSYLNKTPVRESPEARRAEYGMHLARRR